MGRRIILLLVDEECVKGGFKGKRGALLLLMRCSQSERG